MPRGKLTQPGRQIKFSNVAIVRLKRGGKRFELACYQNKIVEWRNGVETKIDNVLQTELIFTNVQQGTVAKRNEVKKAFKGLNEEQIIKLILEKGEVQVGAAERKRDFETLERDIANIVVEKCVHPDTGRPLTISLVLRAMKELHFSPNPTKPAKAQALRVIKDLERKEDFPIERAKMRLRCTLPLALAVEILPDLEKLVAVMESDSRTIDPRTEVEEGKAVTVVEEGKAMSEKEEDGGSREGRAKEELPPAEATFTLTFTIEPSAYREVDQLVRKRTAGAGKMEVITLAVHVTGDAAIE